MELKDFDYVLPKELIAQTPSSERELSRLFVVHKSSKTYTHTVFKNIVDYLDAGDCLVLNNTQVMPARLLGKRKDTGGAMEFVLLKDHGDDIWEVLVRPGKRARIGREFVFGENEELQAEVLSIVEEGNRLVRFKYSGIFNEVLDKVGIMPLPPYITATLEDKNRYQTVYAKIMGSAAAPTAGLHFSTDLMKAIEDKGIDIIYVTLHVGLGTFRPVKVDNIKNHKMHSEYFEIDKEACDRINEVKNRGNRVICVGTTSCRVLESASDESGVLHPYRGDTDIFIYPGYRFKVVNELITNFHLPQSTLLMLVSALAGKDFMLEAYNEAVKEEYRFFSFGDAMFITDKERITE